MIMTENDYDHLFRQLCKLQIEAPCYNGHCVGHQQCEYGISGCYGEECAIEVVREVALHNYKKDIKKKDV